MYILYLFIRNLFNFKRNKDRTLEKSYLIEVRAGDIKEKLDQLVQFMNTNSNNLIRRLHIDDSKNYQLVFEIINFNNNMNVASMIDEIKKIIENANIDITSLNNDIENL